MTRIGTQHQAGSDSLLTAATFFKMRKVFFEDKIEDEFYRSVPTPPPSTNDLFFACPDTRSCFSLKPLLICVSLRNFLYGFGNARVRGDVTQGGVSFLGRNASGFLGTPQMSAGVVSGA